MVAGAARVKRRGPGLRQWGGLMLAESRLARVWACRREGGAGLGIGVGDGGRAVAGFAGLRAFLDPEHLVHQIDGEDPVRVVRARYQPGASGEGRDDGFVDRSGEAGGHIGAGRGAGGQIVDAVDQHLVGIEGQFEDVAGIGDRDGVVSGLQFGVGG
jgi:hypothetical protein